MTGKDIVEKIKTYPHSRKILKGIAIFLVVFSITGFLILPPIVKPILLKKVSEELHREVSLRAVRINPFMLSVKLLGLTIKDKNNTDTFLSCDELYLNFQSMSLFKRGVIISEIKVVTPYLNVKRNDDLTYNFSDLITEKEPKPKTEPMRFSLNNIQVVNGSVDFLDGPKKTQHRVRGMNVAIPFLSNFPYYTNIYVQPSFAANINNTQFSVKGKTKPFSNTLETQIDLNIKDLDIPYYLSYSPFPLDYHVVSGLLSIQGALSFIEKAEGKQSISYSGRVGFDKINISDKKDSPMIVIPSIDLAVAPSNLMAKELHLSGVTVTSPDIYLSRDISGGMNIDALYKQKTTAATQVKANKEDTSLPVVRIDEVKVDNGKITFADQFRDSAFKTVISNITARVNHFSTVRDEKAEASLSLETEAKEAVKFSGNFSMLPLASEGLLELNNIAVSKYSPYYRENVLVGIHDAELNVSTRYKYLDDEKNPVMQVLALQVELNSLKLRQQGEKTDSLNLPLLALKDGEIDMIKREVRIGELSGKKGVININRQGNDKWNVLSFLKEGDFTFNALMKKPAAKVAEKPQTGKKGPEKPWLINIGKLNYEDYAVNIKDSLPAEPVTVAVDRIAIKGENISTAQKSKGKVSFSSRINKTGTVSVAGTVSANPIASSLKIKVNGLDIVPFQPYVTDKIKILVSSGSVSSKGDLGLGYSEKNGLQATYKGDASVTGFHSVDKANAEDFLKFESLYFSNMEVGYNPVRVNIREVALTDFYSRLIIFADGTLNVQNIVEKTAEVKNISEPTQAGAAPAAKPAVPAVPEATAQTVTQTNQEAVSAKDIKIEQVTMQGGTINFTDHFIKPNYSASLLEIGGRVSGLSSEESKMADVDLRGKLGNYAPLEITGKVNPLKKDLFVDLTVDFKDMDLSPLTPYSGKYAGYTIEKGKLALHLKYLIDKRRLDSQNNIFIDQFTFGEKVESPDATKLPVKLAVALLKNRKGEISLDIPVTGNLDDPKFSMGGIIVKIILNLLVKAATSPFSLLSHLFGGGEELSYIEFDYGNIALTEASKKKVDSLVKALYDRPALKLEIEGHADTEKDKEGLRQVLFQRKIKAQKLKDLVKAGAAAPQVDEIVVDDKEYPKYLKLAYKEEKFPKPRNIIGMAKDIPVPEMEKLMLAHLVVTDDDLRQLAASRATSVRDAVLSSKHVEPERVFLVEPKSVQPEKKEKVKESRVDFKLK